MPIAVFAVAVGISTVVLVASMFTAAKFFGMAFGPVKEAALKGAGLIVASSLVSAFWPFAGIVVWVVGLKALFDLEWSEVIILAVINWGLTVLLLLALRPIVAG
jgi:hypothetical protein